MVGIIQTPRTETPLCVSQSFSVEGCCWWCWLIETSGSAQQVRQKTFSQSLFKLLTETKHIQKMSNQLLWQRWKDLHWRARLKVFGCLFNFYCYCPCDAPTGFLWFKVNVFMTAKFYLMQQTLQGGFGPEASSSVACVRHILYQESYSSVFIKYYVW